MRGFKAKVLRRIAESQTVGQPARGYAPLKQQCTPVVRETKTGEKHTVVPQAHCGINVPFSTRAVYRMLKRRFDIKEVFARAK